MNNDTFSLQLKWEPEDKEFSYDTYLRRYTISSEGKPDIMGTAALEYKGVPEHYNPEELFIAALSSCHMLSYLALAAKGKITVIAYEDTPSGSLEKFQSSAKFKEVILKPKVTIADSISKEHAYELHKKAHHICFIANSVNFPVCVNPEIIVE